MFFLSKTNKPYIRTNIEIRMRKINETIRERYGTAFSEVTPHYFRHTVASRAIENSVPQLYIQKLCGWLNAVMLSKIYGHMSEQQAQKAMNMIPELNSR